jgi:hypothetical protein
MLSTTDQVDLDADNHSYTLPGAVCCQCADPEFIGEREARPIAE